jgi:hypothetical protein
MHILGILLLIFYFNTKVLPINLYIILTLWIIGLFVAIACISIKSDAYFFHTSYLLLLLMFFPYILSAYLGDQVRGYKLMSDEINQLDPTKKLEVITYRVFIPSIYFYRNKNTIAAFYSGREIQFERNNRYKKYLIDDEVSFSNLLNKLKRFFVVANPQDINELVKKHFLHCNIIALQHDHTAYLCKSQ